MGKKILMKLSYFMRALAREKYDDCGVWSVEVILGRTKFYVN